LSTLSSIAIGCALVVTSRDARAVQTELVGGLGIEAPAASDYRSAANALGYGLGYPRLAYEAELGARFAVAFDRRLWIGPIFRANVHRMGAPYDGMDPLWAEGYFAAMREEFLFAKYPPLFLWADESIGLARIGASGSYANMASLGIRGGLGIRIGWPEHALRARIGYGWSPTLSNIAYGGKYDFGGVMFTIDGVLRVVDE
jgi:hypothetical protein